MKTIVVGDLHCKMSLVLPRLFEVAQKQSIERVVFTGDLCDDWNARGIEMLRELDYTEAWIDKAVDEGIAIDVLIGNHDCAYLGMERYSFTDLSVRHEAEDILTNGLQVKMATTIDDHLVTHAGLTKEWGMEKELSEGMSTDQIADQLNAMFEDPSQWKSLATCGPRRGGWGIPGPLWADEIELRHDPFPGVNQIVGHTPQETVRCFKQKSGQTIRFVDTLSTSTSGRAISDSGVLLVHDGNFESFRLFDDWQEALQAWREQNGL